MKRKNPCLLAVGIIGLALTVASYGAAVTEATTSTTSTSQQPKRVALKLSAAPTGNLSLKGDKVAIIINGSPNDHGYNKTGALAGKLINDRLGAEVTVKQLADLTKQKAVFRAFAQQGYKFLIGWGGQFTEGAEAAANAYPNTTVLCVDCSVANGKNLASLDQKAGEWEFVSGWVLAHISKTDTIGLIGSQCFNVTARTVNGLKQGAKYANPNIKVLMAYTGSFEDPTKAMNVADSMIAAGAGALAGNMNNAYYGVYKAAESHGDVPVINEWIDSHKLRPKVIAASTLKSLTPFALEAAKMLAAGKLRPVVYEVHMPPSSLDPAISKTDLIPESVYKGALKIQDEIASGKLKFTPDATCPH